LRIDLVELPQSAAATPDEVVFPHKATKVG
jgi:hypothetical protein